MSDDRRLIEGFLPIQAISAEVSRGKSPPRNEAKGRLRGHPVRLTTNEWYKAQQLAETYWLYVVWNPLGDSPELVSILNPVAKLDHAKRERGGGVL